MPVLPNPRHERFAQELAKGKTADEAYVTAGYSENRGNATRMNANESVMKRVVELQDRGAARAEVTVESLILEAEDVRLKATAAGQFNAAIQAIREKGVLSGKRVERAEMGKPGDFSRMNDAELREFIAARAGRASGGLPRIGNEGIESGLRPAGRPH